MISLDQNGDEDFRMAGPFDGLGRVFSAGHQRSNDISSKRDMLSGPGWSSILIHQYMQECGYMRASITAASILVYSVERVKIAGWLNSIGFVLAPG